MLIGQYETRLSQKRRAAVPKNFRKELGKNMIVAKWYEGCLVLVSEDNWKELLNRLTGKKGIITNPVRDTDRFILGSAFELEPDSQGRVIIPALLTEYANLTEDVVFVGLGDRVEIWSKDEWQKRQKHISDSAAELVEKLADHEE